MTPDACLKILNIRGEPTKTAIKKAFRQAVLKYHPDVHGSDTTFIQIKTAYDTLMALPDDIIATHAVHSRAVTHSTYNPFHDPDYATRVFFTPDNPNSAAFERKIRAKHCPYCHGHGFFTENTNPAQGFIGRERRLCKCQWA